MNYDIFEDEAAARDYLEQRRWPSGPACNFCGSGNVVATSQGHWEKRDGLWYCWGCRCEFTVTATTFLHRTHLPLTTWLAAVRLYSERGGEVTARDFERSFFISYKSAWRVRNAIRISIGEHRKPMQWKRRKIAHGKYVHDPQGADTVEFEQVVESLLKTQLRKKNGLD